MSDRTAVFETMKQIFVENGYVTQAKSTLHEYAKKVLTVGQMHARRQTRNDNLILTPSDSLDVALDADPEQLLETIILSNLKSSSKKVPLWAVKALLFAKREAPDSFKDYGKSLNEDILVERPAGVKTEREKESWIPLYKLPLAVKYWREEYNRKPSRETSNKMIIAALWSLYPAQRANQWNYVWLNIVDPQKNSLEFRQDGSVWVHFNVFKTVKRMGPQQFQLPELLVNVIKEHLKNTGNRVLLFELSRTSDENEEDIAPLRKRNRLENGIAGGNPSFITRNIQTVFSVLGVKKMNATILRHIWSSEFPTDSGASAESAEVAARRKWLARRMLHSVTIQQSTYARV